MKRGLIYIDKKPQMTSVALIEEGRLNEFYIEDADKNRLTGNVYKGKIINILPGLESVFVDIGREKNGFLYMGDAGEDSVENLRPHLTGIKEGEYIMVQVVKEEVLNKGARLTTNISLPARNIVYLPNTEFKGVSNKITDEEVRERLLKIIDKIKDDKEGIIARTNCSGAKKSDMSAELKQLRQLYKEIELAYLEADGVQLLHCEGNIVLRTVRDMISKNIDSIYCNDKETVEDLRRYFKRNKAASPELVKYFESDYEMADLFKINDELEKLVCKKVELKSGATLIIDKAEALTAIDVNTAKFKGNLDSSHEETVFLTNLEAAKEIARQIRLRNIGGIIIIDFIDMQDEEHRRLVVEALKREVVFDRIKTKVLDMTQLGLVEIARKKVGREISSFIADTCKECSGNGVMLSSKFMASKLRAALKRLFAEENCESVIVNIDPYYIENIIAQRLLETECETEWANKRIYLVPKSGTAFTLTASKTLYLSLPNNAKLLY